MKSIVAVLVAAALSGCASLGPSPGGANYTLKFNDAGQLVAAHANVMNESESVALVVERRADGSESFSFEKIGTKGNEEVIKLLAQQQAVMLELFRSLAAAAK